MIKDIPANLAHSMARREVDDQARSSQGLERTLPGAVVFIGGGVIAYA